MIRLPNTNAITFEITVYFDSSKEVNGLIKSYFDSIVVYVTKSLSPVFIRRYVLKVQIRSITRVLAKFRAK